MTADDIPILDELAERLGPFHTDFEKRQRAAAQARNAELSSYVKETMSALNLGGGIVSAETVAERVGEAGPSTTLAERAAADRTWTYGHVVVDEAQELTPMQWEMLIRRCPTRSMTIVGDLDQRPSGAPRGGWKAILGRLGGDARERDLTVSYRTPAQILRAAERALRAAGVTVRAVRAARDVQGSLTLERAERDLAARLVEAADRCRKWMDGEYGEGLGTLAVIAPESLLDDVSRRVADHPGLARWAGSADSTARVHVPGAVGSQGLEYDAVVLAEPAAVLEEGPGNLYVAMTRPTRRLHVVHSRPLPEGLDPREEPAGTP